ncbi:hypothetical protein POSPLADRAFT_1066896 [Postia placenta MAD-698-R-SB12]|uniref:Peptidase A1 domain-containing protein n=1 Tax=Postia placenta MAD-698-R-SB12 TaxID=670580 RepID=A0A1X6MU16_9APHY|nr:hypothetical protein POSPLADRAFT_1066896 [Postia placenta MAD-698-R-SB12]OSX59716.1 hypothetical protein POSPLADRAFT_1066896 [Postia placenta MAD-698-R-SB12]
MYTAGLCTLFSLLMSSLVSGLPVRVVNGGADLRDENGARRRGITLPMKGRAVVKRNVEELLVGSIGLGDFADVVYTVAIQIGNTTTAVNLDTGSSDLWVMSTSCQTSVCRQSNATAFSVATFQSTEANVNLTFGDATTGTFAAGPIGLDNVTLAGLSLPNQPFAAVDNTDNTAVLNGGAGIIGLGFPAESTIQNEVVAQKFNNPSTTDDFISNINTYGPFVSRLVASGVIDQPLFAITLQRDTIDVSGSGKITIGELPAGVDNSSITWVPVRLYDPAEGGLDPPTFASNESYPLRWEVPIENVYLDGKQLANSTIPPNGVPSSFVSALIDSGNSLIRGPQDVVNNILSTVSPPTLPCASAHNLTYQIGGRLFPVDPRDFIAQAENGNASTCVASSVVSTDPPSVGTLFSWSLGDPFLKSNMVVFYYGNLTHPSVDPPRIGFRSMVPTNASALLDEAVSVASQDHGNFESTVNVAPTSSEVFEITVTSTATTSAPSHSMPPIDRTSSQNSSASVTKPHLFRSCFSIVAPVVYLSFLLVF